MADQDSVTVTTCTGKLRSFIYLQAYRFSFGKIIKKLDKEKEKLISNRDSVLKKVEQIGRKTSILKWLNDVDEAIADLEMLDKKPEIESPLGINRLADHHSYWLYDEMLERMSKLNYTYINLNFDPPQPLEKFASGYFECFKAIKEASDKLLKALEDDSSYIIGLYGRRGSGKTTLAEAVCKRSTYLNMFDKIAFATVPEDINVRRIQEEIALSLKLKFSDQRKEGRAGTISSAFNTSTRILVILDDVRGKFELKDIGVPSKGNPRMWKVLVTTINQQECTLMDCLTEIPIHPSSEEEAWTMFKKYSDINEDSSSDLLNVAQEVAFECEGLPGTIKKVGSFLRSEPIEVWKTSLDKLKHSKACDQIFLSFEGGDTGQSFIDFLYHDLCKAGFKTFMDDGGEQITPSLVKAIEASWLSIIVLSENYADSTRCLDELVKILECKNMRNQLVLPIFYKVEPSNIRYQQKSYGKAMAEHGNMFANEPEKIQKWKSALFEISKLSGKAYHKTGYEYEYEFIQKIKEDVKSFKNHLDVHGVHGRG